MLKLLGQPYFRVSNKRNSGRVVRGAESVKSAGRAGSGVASYGTRALPRLLTVSFLFHFGVNLTANYPSIV